MNQLSVLLQAQQGGGMWSSLLMIVAIIVIFYFFMIRPQQKRQKEEKKFRENLTKGQKVVTIAGLHGKVTDVRETTVMLEIANEVRVEVEKVAIAMTFATEQKN